MEPVNLLAIHESYNHTLPDDAAIVAVYDEGAGGALLLNGSLDRGARNEAGRDAASGQHAGPGPCGCSIRYSHLHEHGGRHARATAT